MSEWLKGRGPKWKGKKGVPPFKYTEYTQSIITTFYFIF